MSFLSYSPYSSPPSYSLEELEHAMKLNEIIFSSYSSINSLNTSNTTNNQTNNNEINNDTTLSNTLTNSTDTISNTISHNNDTNNTLSNPSTNTNNENKYNQLNNWINKLNSNGRIYLNKDNGYLIIYHRILSNNIISEHIWLAGVINNKRGSGIMKNLFKESIKDMKLNIITIRTSNKFNAMKNFILKIGFKSIEKYNDEDESELYQISLEDFKLYFNYSDEDNDENNKSNNSNNNSDSNNNQNIYSNNSEIENKEEIK